MNHLRWLYHQNQKKTPSKKTQVLESPTVVEQHSPAQDTPVSAKDVSVAPEKKIKTVELHKCDKCNKEMTLRALRYTHPKYCTGEEINRNDIPVKRQVKSTTVINNVVEITPDIIEHHFKKVRENKTKERQEKISKLVAKIV